MFNIFEELTWPQFTQLSEVIKLSLNEQVEHYNQYLYDLSIARQNWLAYQNKGPIERYLAQEEFDIAHEDYFLILQEDGSKIILT